MKGVDNTNFLLSNPFAADNTHMEGRTRTDNDVPWIADGQISVYPFKETGATFTNDLTQQRIVPLFVCDCNLRMKAESQISYVNRCFATQAVFN
jgi:hypothetical protein